MYILLEGIDGTGKSTQLRAYKREISRFITTKEPAGTEVGLRLERWLLNG